MTDAVAAVGRRYLPRGWSHFWLQLGIWFGFLAVYQVVRGVADRDPVRAFANGLRVIAWEQTHAHHLFELALQRYAATSSLLETAVSWTYWNSEFTVVGFALLWVYLRRNEHFRNFRNWVLLAGVISFVGYVVYPTAPPRMFSGFGFVDTLAQFASLNHGSGFASRSGACCPRATLSTTE